MSTPLPETVKHGFVQGRIVLSVGDDSDEDQLPNAVPAVGAISFTALNRITREYEAVPPTTIVGTRVTRALNENGVLVNTDGTPGIWLSVGPHKVAYLLDDVEIPRHDIEVTELHTPDNPLDLTEAIPPGGPVLTPTEYADLVSKFTTLETRVVASVAAPAAQASIDAASASASATSASSSAISALNSANSADADRIAAEAAKLSAQAAEESAAISETSAVQAALASIAARDTSVSAKDTSVAAKDDAVIAKTAAEAASATSIAARDISVSAKDTSVAAKTAAETAATNAQQAVTVHESAADPHTQYHTNARGDARYALIPAGTPDGTKFYRDDGTWAPSPVVGVVDNGDGTITITYT